MLALCIGLIGINLDHANTAREQAITAAQASLVNVAQSVAAHASDTLYLCDTLATSLAQEFETYGTTPEMVLRLARIAALRMADLPMVLNVVAIDAQAAPLFSIRPSAALQAQLLTREFFTFHRDNADRAIHISRPIRMISQGRWLVTVSRRISRADGSFAGVVAASVDLHYFEQFYQDLTRGGEDSVGLYYADGTPLAENRPKGASSDMPNRLMTEAVPDQSQRTWSTIDATGTAVPRLHAFSRTERYNQIAIASMPLTLVLSERRASGRVALISAAITAILLGILGLILFNEVRSRQSVESAMQESETRFGLMIDGLEDYAIFMRDPDGLIKTWNSGAQRMTGFSADEIIGTAGAAFYCDKEAAMSDYKTAMAIAKQDGRAEHEGWRVRKDGRRFLVHAITTPLYDSSGVLYGYLKILRDITASKQLAAEMTASEFLWKNAIEGAGGGVWDLNDQEGTIQVSRNLMVMLGYGDAEMPAGPIPWINGINRDDLPRVQAALDDHRQGRTPYYSCEHRMRCKDGSMKWMLARGLVVSRDAAGKSLRIIGTQSDISHLKSIEQRLNEQNALVMKQNAQLLQASRFKSEFLANMSHELRTPLNAVLGFTGTILMELPGPLNTAQKNQLQIVRSSANHLLALINEILDLAKIEAGASDIAFRATCCQDVIADVTKSLMPLATQKQIAIDLEMQEAPIEIRTDDGLLKKILINLIGNAIKFTENGHVTVRLRHLTDLVGGLTTIDVIDTGIGIREEDLDKLFLPFSQIETGLSRRFEGTGLGLNVSKKYADLIGATLTVTSDYGQGSTFSVSIPEVEQAA
ncbi:MAG: PAS domain S-box protein [Herminiimonas sp.]|nr:PAS domain S-box protein [Herminiimonas sp.]